GSQPARDPHGNASPEDCRPPRCATERPSGPKTPWTAHAVQGTRHTIIIRASPVRPTGLWSWSGLLASISHGHGLSNDIESHSALVDARRLTGSAPPLPAPRSLRG